MPFATFVLSTGRCGTQWLAHHLAGIGVPGLTVEHEPLSNSYQPRLMLGAKDPANLDPQLAAPILAHADRIEQALETGDYIECGHPCWSTLPYFAKRFAGRMRIIHLVRHPVPTACSWLTHQAYCTPLLPHLPAKVLLSPFDAGVRFLEYCETWPELNPYEKALYYWTEINAAGLEWEQSLGVPWLRVTYEDVFGGQGLPALHDFLGIEAGTPAKTGLRVDQFYYISAGLYDWQGIANHPHTLQVCQQLDYDPMSVNGQALQQRYLAGVPISSSAA
ncbi:MAG: hypothetical protein JWO89_2596 [Verrucomicrobiaceae bacterium]|nr:hypothetical protein [Verrucomicrobiaceae bacterium]